VSQAVDAIWLATLQKLSAHVAHDLKGALNGVSVNLEVVRSRSEKATSAGADVHRFAANAADQLAIVIRATTSLLSLARGTRGPAEVSMVAKQVAGLLDDMIIGRESRFQVSVDGGMAAETSAPLNAVRIAVAECMLAAGGGSGPVSVRVTGLPTPVVKITPGQVPDIPEDARAALDAAGIRFATDGHGISIGFPGPPALPH
jgi:signal transduction histidine kinase